MPPKRNRNRKKGGNKPKPQNPKPDEAPAPEQHEETVVPTQSDEQTDDASNASECAPSDVEDDVIEAVAEPEGPKETEATPSVEEEEAEPETAEAPAEEVTEPERLVHNSGQFTVERNQFQAAKYYYDSVIAARWLNEALAQLKSPYSVWKEQILAHQLMDGHILAAVSAVVDKKTKINRPGSSNKFMHRENVSRFIAACGMAGVDPASTMEVDDIVDLKNPWKTVKCIIDFAQKVNLDDIAVLTTAEASQEYDFPAEDEIASYAIDVGRGEDQEIAAAVMATEEKRDAERRARMEAAKKAAEEEAAAKAAEEEAAAKKAAEEEAAAKAAEEEAAAKKAAEEEAAAKAAEEEAAAKKAAEEEAAAKAAEEEAAAKKAAEEEAAKAAKEEPAKKSPVVTSPPLPATEILVGIDTRIDTSAAVCTSFAQLVRDCQAEDLAFLDDQQLFTVARVSDGAPIILIQAATFHKLTKKGGDVMDRLFSSFVLTVNDLALEQGFGEETTPKDHPAFIYRAAVIALGGGIIPDQALLKWLSMANAKLPRTYRKGCAELVIIHKSNALRTLFPFLRAFGVISVKFVSKVKPIKLKGKTPVAAELAAHYAVDEGVFGV